MGLALKDRCIRLRNSFKASGHDHLGKGRMCEIGDMAELEKTKFSFWPPSGPTDAEF